jgi:hypothetical protein
VQGQLKPSNFLVVNDQLKLASDTVRSSRDAAGIDLAQDMRALGATMVEALTQIRPALNNPSPALPATLSPGLADAVLRCLSPEPGNRPTASELRGQIDPALETVPPPAPATQMTAPAAPAPPASVSQMPAPNLPAANVPASQAPAQAVLAPAMPATCVAEEAAVSGRPNASPLAAFAPSLRWLVPAAALGLVLLAVWAGGRLLRSHSHSVPPMSEPIASQSTPTLPTAQPSVTTRSPASPVLHEEIPTVSRGARASIHGQIKITVHVTVDSAGNVVAENLEQHGSSKYFARLASDSARKWKFAPGGQSPREWLLQFEFSRDGVTGHAVPRAKQ